MNWSSTFGKRWRKIESALGHQGRAGRREARQAQAPALETGDLGELALGLLEAAHHRVAVGHQRLAGGGQLGPDGRSLEQRDADLALEDRDLLAHRGLREVKRLGRRGERAARDDLLQHPQSAARRA